MPESELYFEPPITAEEVFLDEDLVAISHPRGGISDLRGMKLSELQKSIRSLSPAALGASVFLLNRTNYGAGLYNEHGVKMTFPQAASGDHCFINLGYGIPDEFRDVHDPHGWIQDKPSQAATDQWGPLLGQDRQQCTLLLPPGLYLTTSKTSFDAPSTGGILWGFLFEAAPSSGSAGPIFQRFAATSGVVGSGMDGSKTQTVSASQVFIVDDPAGVELTPFFGGEGGTGPDLSLYTLTITIAKLG